MQMHKDRRSVEPALINMATYAHVCPHMQLYHSNRTCVLTCMYAQILGMQRTPIPSQAGACQLGPMEIALEAPQQKSGLSLL